MTGGRFALVAAMALAGCVAPTMQQSSVTKTSTDPRVEPILEGLIDETPVWEARPVSANAETIGQSIYIVKAGDTLRAIGELTRVGSETIARTNKLSAPFRLYSGQVLRIPAGRYHRVSAGETGIAIAHAYGIRWRDIVASNDLSEPFVLRVGQRLQLPWSIALTPEARAAAFRVDIDDLETGSAPAQTIISDVLASRFAGRFSWPLSGAVSEGFGPAGKGRLNEGIEVTGESGSDIRAAANGTVAFVGNGGPAGYGGVILVRHGDGWISVYGRVAQAVVSTGQTVRDGQTIGWLGNEAKLHFELRKNRMPVDPLKHLPAR